MPDIRRRRHHHRCRRRRSQRLFRIIAQLGEYAILGALFGRLTDEKHAPFSQLHTAQTFSSFL